MENIYQKNNPHSYRAALAKSMGAVSCPQASIATKITVSDKDEMMKHYLRINLLDPNLTDRSTDPFPGATTSEYARKMIKFRGALTTPSVKDLVFH